MRRPLLTALLLGVCGMLVTGVFRFEATGSGQSTEGDPSRMTRVSASLAPSSRLALSSTASEPKQPVTEAESLPQTAPTERNRTIGSEGFGPHIQRAVTSQDPDDAAEAVHWLDLCVAMKNSGDAIYKVEPRNPGEAQALSDTVAHVQRTLALCQTVTPNLYAMRKALVRRALDAGMPGAGIEFSRSLGAVPDPSEFAVALSAIRREAERCDVAAMHALTFGQANRLHIPPPERLRNEQALREWVHLQGSPVFSLWRGGHFKAGEQPAQVLLKEMDRFSVQVAGMFFWRQVMSADERDAATAQGKALGARCAALSKERDAD